MNGYVTQLEQALHDAARREYGHGHGHGAASRMLHIWRVPLRSLPAVAVAVTLMILAAATAAAIVVLGDRGSAPLSGTVPILRMLHYDVPVTPDIEAGHAGWCSFPRFSIAGIPPPLSGGGTCSPAYPPGTPILLAGGEPLSNTRNLLGSAHRPLTTAQGNQELFWAVVNQTVAAVRLQTRLTVTATRDARLPPGWKAVVTFVSGQIDPVALDSSGRVMREAGTIRQLIQAASRAYDPRRAGGATPCAIRASPLAWVTASWQVVATRVPALGSAVEPNVLFSCARSWYSVRGSSAAASAAILLSARQPRGTAPQLPGLTPTARRGVFAEDGGAGAPIIAKRVGHAWLIVQGPSPVADMALRGALHVQGSALG